MPCIVMYTNVEVPKEKAEELKKALVVSWEKLPGKSERWLMTTIRDNTTMFFGGKDTPAAFVNFKILPCSSAAPAPRRWPWCGPRLWTWPSWM